MPIYADRAENDKDGNRIDQTYAKSASLATVATTGDYDDLTDKPDLSIYAESSNLATVATTGSYEDLVDKPTIPAAQVNSDWNSNSGVSQILNKPTLSTVATTGDYNDLSNKPSIPAAQINSDWSESDTTSKAYIQNKPDLSVYATDSELTSGLATKQDVISDLATIRSGAAAGATAVQASDLATVATTGDYNDLDNKPIIPTVDQSYSSSSTNAQSGTAVAQAISGVDAVPDVTSSDSGKVLVATYSGGTGSYAWASTPPANAIILDFSSTWSDFHTAYSAGRKDIYYKHTSPYPPFDSRAELYLHLTAVSDVDGSSANFTYALFEGAWQSAGVNYTVRCQFRYSGNPLVFLNGLSVDQSYSASSRAAQSGVAVAQAISAVNQVPSSTASDADKVLTVNSLGTPEWATAQVGPSYTAGTGIDITNNVVSVDTTVVATQTDLAGKQDVISDLATIRSGASLGATSVQPSDLATVATTGSYADLSNTPSIPTATSDLTNDSGFITLSDVPAQVNADWNAVSGAAEILNKPSIPSGAQLVPAATSADADKVLTVDSQGTPAWASAQAPISAGNGIDITNNVVSVDTSVVATQTDLADKEDAFDVGTGLEMDTSGATPTLQVEAPVDIVAGPGIVIDNPDGNTLRVSTDENYETVLWSGTAAIPNFPITLSEVPANFERVRISFKSWTDNPTFNEFPGSANIYNLNSNWSDGNGVSFYFNERLTLSGTTLSFISGKFCAFGDSVVNNQTGNFTVYKIVGIHRIANN